MSFWPTFHSGEELFFLSVVMSLTVGLGFSGMCPIFPPCAKVLHVVVFMIFMFFFFSFCSVFYCFFVFFIVTFGLLARVGVLVGVLFCWCHDVMMWWFARKNDVRIERRVQPKKFQTQKKMNRSRR
jgi:hypothetical protein